jgi:hypothetical protein
MKIKISDIIKAVKSAEEKEEDFEAEIDLNKNCTPIKHDDFIESSDIEDEKILQGADIKELGREFDRVTALKSAYLDAPVRDARDKAKKGDESARGVLIKDIMGRMKTRDKNAYKNLIRNLQK